MSLAASESDDRLPDLRVFEVAVRFAYTECPGLFLEHIDRTVAYRIATLREAVTGCLYGSVCALLFAVIGFWWAGLLSLPFSLGAAYFTRRWRAARKPWRAPVVAEIGATRLFPGDTCLSSLIGRK